MRMFSLLRSRSSKVKKRQCSDSPTKVHPEESLSPKSQFQVDPLRMSVSTCSTDISDRSDTSPSPPSSRHSSPSRSLSRQPSLVYSRSSVASVSSSLSSDSSQWCSSVASHVSQTSRPSKRSSISSTSSAWSDFDEVVAELENRGEWFSHWDSPEHGGNGTGQLSSKQVVHALSRAWPQQDKRTIEMIISQLWVDFDENKEGALSSGVLMKPQFGLIDTAHMLMSWNM